ncbi:M56 family metallopeptidase [Prevotella sp. 10(H)]|uniref:M56 family metallopeptidase n=1 Tax=Prevotella sp. 10(H) TaxID=1158294 RepID=UPI0009DF448D|nr:M56 family metallopeptidase [Prevotella sp. 10(H)]
MDYAIIIYLAKVSIALALFYGLYLLFLRKDTFLRLRRGFFLIALLFSLLFPAFTIEIPATSDTPLYIPAYWLPEAEAIEIVADADSESALIDMRTIALGVLFTISLICALKFIFQLLSIVRLRFANESEEKVNCRIIKVKDKKASPFSFFGWIFINRDMDCAAKLDEIIAHEQVHVRQYHSIDVLLFEIFCICFWWNPFAWLLKKEMKLNLEYLADEGVLNSGYNTKEYQYILLEVSSKNTGISLINNFNVSQLKKRISMMNKQKSSIISSLKYMLAVPLGIVLLLGNAIQATTTLNDFSIDGITEVIDELHSPQENADAYNSAEVMPEFPGGADAMMSFINNTRKYPVSAIDKKAEGRVMVRFVVKSTGEVAKAEVWRGINPDLDKEAVRIVSAMPKWIPGKQGGKAVDTYFNLPVIFKMPADSREKAVAGSGNQVPKTGKEKTEETPSFPKGEAAMQAFIAANMKYPVEAQKEGLQGRVLVKFMVKSTGDITDISIVRGIDPLLDTEALRVVKSMPKWNPGKKDGKAVDTYFTLPFVFRLSKGDCTSSINKEAENDSNTLFVYNGKLVKAAEFKKYEESIKSQDNKGAITTIMVLSEADGVKKYGQKAKGKKVVEMSTPAV